MSKYRKLPVVIEAFQWDGSVKSATALLHWIDPSLPPDAVANEVTVKTLEGEMRADPGDWIIKGVKGEFYPCKPDIFAAIYEQVSECTDTCSPKPSSPQTITVHDGHGKNPTVLNKAQYDAIYASGMLWEFHPDAPLQWPFPVEATPSTEPATPCEGCGKPATHSDSEGVPLCKECYDELPVIKDEAQPQPAPALAWHREAAICIMGLNYPPGDAVTNIAHIIAVHHWSHDPHAETVRLLEEAAQRVIEFGSSIEQEPIAERLAEQIRDHLAKLKGTS